MNPKVDTAIFIRTYQNDFPWLNYCLRSIQKFASGFSEVIIAVPEGQERALSHLTAETVITLHDGKPGYLCQQADKLNAHQHTRASNILHFDADMIFRRPVTPDYFFHEGRPIWTITQWGNIPGKAEKHAWFHVLAKAMQECPPFEYMRKCAVIVPRWLYSALADHMEELHGIPLTSYIMNQPGHEFTEYNVAGFFAWLKHRDKFHWHDTEIDGVPEWPFKQYWSHSGMKEEGHHGPTRAERAEIEAILQ